MNEKGDMKEEGGMKVIQMTMINDSTVRPDGESKEKKRQEMKRKGRKEDQTINHKG